MSFTGISQNQNQRTQNGYDNSRNFPSQFPHQSALSANRQSQTISPTPNPRQNLRLQDLSFEDHQNRISFTPTKNGITDFSASLELSPENVPYDFKDQHDTLKKHTLRASTKLRTPFRTELAETRTPENLRYKRDISPTIISRLESPETVKKAPHASQDTSRIQNEIALLRAEIQRLQAEKLQMTNYWEDQLRNSNQFVAKEFLEKLREAELEKNKLRQALEDHQDQAENDLEKKEKKISELEKQISEERRKNRENEKLSRLSLNTFSSEERTKLLAELSNTQATNEQLAKLLAEHTEKAKAYISELEVKNETLNNQVQQYSEDLQKKAVEIEDLVRRLQDSENLRNDKEEIDNLNFEIKKLKIVIEEKNNVIANLQSKKAPQENKCDIAEGIKSVLLMTEIERLHSIMKEFTIELDKKEGQSQQRIEKNKSSANYRGYNTRDLIETEIEMLRKKVLELDQKCQELSKENAHLRLEVLDHKTREDYTKYQINQRNTAGFYNSTEEKERNSGNYLAREVLAQELKNKEISDKLIASEQKCLILTHEIDRLSGMIISLNVRNQDLQKQLSNMESDYNKSLDDFKLKVEEYVNTRLKEELKKAEDDWNKERETKDRLIEAHRRHIQKLKNKQNGRDSDLKQTGEILSKNSDSESIDQKNSINNSDLSKSSEGKELQSV